MSSSHSTPLFANLWMLGEFGNALVSHATLVINKNVNSVLGMIGSAKPFAAAVRRGGTMKSVWSLLAGALQAEGWLAHTALYW